MHLIQGLNTLAFGPYPEGCDLKAEGLRALSRILHELWMHPMLMFYHYSDRLTVLPDLSFWPCFLVVGQIFRRPCGTVACRRLPLLHVNLQHNLVNFVEVV